MSDNPKEGLSTTLVTVNIPLLHSMLGNPNTDTITFVPTPERDSNLEL